MKHNCAVLITSAGNSIRMGSHKALLKCNDQLFFFEKLIETYSSIGCSEIIMTINEDLDKSIKKSNFKNVKFVLNMHPESERLYSIQIGLKAIEKSEYCFIQAIDNPLINKEVLIKLYESKKNNYFLVPSVKGRRGHPILINKMIIEYLCKIELNDIKLNEALKQFDKEEIEVNDDCIFYNINTLEDYNRIIT